jgi:hypothetical protein
MPDWAIGVVLAVITATGGFVVKVLIGISNVMGRIDSKMDDHDDRLRVLEDLHPRGPGAARAA